MKLKYQAPRGTRYKKQFICMEIADHWCVIFKSGKHAWVRSEDVDEYCALFPGEIDCVRSSLPMHTVREFIHELKELHWRNQFKDWFLYTPPAGTNATLVHCRCGCDVYGKVKSP